MTYNLTNTAPFQNPIFQTMVTSVQDDGYVYALGQLDGFYYNAFRWVPRERLARYSPTTGEWNLLTEKIEDPANTKTFGTQQTTQDAYLLAGKYGNKLWGVASYLNQASPATNYDSAWYYDLSSGARGVMPKNFVTSYPSDGGAASATMIGGSMYVWYGPTQTNSSIGYVMRYDIGSDVWVHHSDTPALWSGDRPELSFATWQTGFEDSDSRLLNVNGTLYFVHIGQFATNSFSYNSYNFNSEFYFPAPRIYKYTNGNWVYVTTAPTVAQTAIAVHAYGDTIILAGGTHWRDGRYAQQYSPDGYDWSTQQGPDRWRSEVFAYNAASGSWSQLEDLPKPVIDGGVVSVGGGALALMGGYSPQPRTGDDWLITTPSQNTATAPEPAKARRSHVYLAGSHQMVSYAGGDTFSGCVPTELMDIGNQYWYKSLCVGPGKQLIFRNEQYWTGLAQKFDSDLIPEFPQDYPRFTNDSEDTDWSSHGPYYSAVAYDQANECYWALHNWTGNLDKWSPEGTYQASYVMPSTHSFADHAMASNGKKFAVHLQVQGAADYTTCVAVINTTALASLPDGSTIPFTELFSLTPYHSASGDSDQDFAYIGGGDGIVMAWTPSGELGVVVIDYRTSYWSGNTYIYMISEDGNVNRKLPLSDTMRTSSPRWYSAPSYASQASLAFVSGDIAYYYCSKAYVSDTSYSTKYNKFYATDSFTDPDTGGSAPDVGMVYEAIFKFNPVTGEGLDVPLQHELSANVLDDYSIIYASGYLASQMLDVSSRFSGG